jgi:hypothetical protein
MDDTEKILLRLKAVESLKTDKQLSVLFNLSEQDFNKRKKAKTINKIILKYCINKKVDLNWIFLGERGGPQAGGDPHIAALLEKARKVLESGSHFAPSLTANIESFHTAIETEGSLAQRVEVLEKSFRRASEQVRSDDPPEKKDEIIKRRGISSG